ncbi:MAG: putative molybdenum carrier protein [Dehalococcoidia bacterium]|nr:putative molybdenum carrier protein [Dehalococcoidia bacterium]
MAKFKIISGGQTGVDRAALDAALQTGIECGGWCPKGRLAEDGTIPPHYPLSELKNTGYKERSLQNVIGSDGTVVIYFDSLSGGTEQTLLFCLNKKKPYLLIDATELSPERAIERIHKFVAGNSITTLNVAGPRASGEAFAYAYTLKVMTCYLNVIHQKV